MQTQIDKACDFVETHGAPWQQAIARYTANRIGQSEALQALAKHQNPDGGWCHIGTLKAPITTISNTLNGLLYLTFLDAHNSPQLDNTISFLQQCQHPKGCWDEPEEILQHAPSKWMVPGQYPNQVWYTAAICRYLHQLNRLNDIAFDTALSFLHQAWNGEEFPMYIHTHWVAFYLFSQLPEQNALHQQIITHSLKHITAFAHKENVNHGELGEVALSALLTGQQGQELLQHLLHRFATTQGPTGYWGTPQSTTEDRVTNTIKILGFLHHYHNKPR